MSSLLQTKFEGSELDYLGQLIVAPKMVPKQIRETMDNKSLGVDGIPPKLLLEIVEQIGKPLPIEYTLSLDEEVVPLEWKEANTLQLFKTQLPETSQRTIDQ